MAIIYSNLAFDVGIKVELVGLVDNVGATDVLFNDNTTYPLTAGEFRIDLGSSLAINDYNIKIQIIGGVDDGEVYNDTLSIVDFATTPEEIEASIIRNDSKPDYISDYAIGVESDTSNVQVYPGSTVGFKPLEHNSDVTDAQLAIDPSVGYSKKFPVRRMMQDEVRAEYFPFDGDYDKDTVKQYPLGRRADLIDDGTVEPANILRGGANSSAMSTTGFTF